MNEQLEEIFRTREFQSTDNKKVKIAGETPRDQCEFLQNLIQDNNYKKSLEIGLAYGMSAVAITEAVVNNGGSHFVMDVFQKSMCNNYGLDLLKKTGLIEKVEFKEEYCYTVLPKLLNEGRKFDFAYIDSTKQFDWLLVDFFYIDKLMEVGGMIVFDDVDFESVKKLLRYISQFPSYKVYDQIPKNRTPTFKRRIFESLRNLPKAKRYIKEELLVSNNELKINSQCVALLKKTEDKRSPVWHVDF
jgi:predicted O-methyltransferase YrrM